MVGLVALARGIGHCGCLPRLEAVFNHWKRGSLKRDITLEGLKDDFGRVKVVPLTASKPIEDNHAFWKAVIKNKVVFPMMQYMLRMVLALTHTSVEQLLMLAMDTDRWYEYDYTPALDIICQNQRRAQLCGPRIDKGITGKKRKLQAMIYAWRCRHCVVRQ